MTTFNTSIGAYGSPAAGKAVPATHVSRAFNNTLAIKQGDQAFDFLIGLELAVTTTGSQNDWSPGTGVVVRWNGASQLTITGLVAHSAGDIRVIRNVTSAQFILLQHQDGSSSAANRIILPGALPLYVGPDGCVVLQYDGTTSRWRLVSMATETGTWTPTMTDLGTGTHAPTYATQVGHYVKTMRKVELWGRITLATKGTIVNGDNLVITGLPFTTENTSNLFGVFFVPYFSALATAVTQVTGFIQTNTTQVLLKYLPGATGGTGVVNLTGADIGGTVDIIFGGSYKSAS